MLGVISLKVRRHLQFFPVQWLTLMVLLGAGRLAMLAFVGFVMAAQVTGLGPLAALGQHLSDPISAPPGACCAACRSIAAVLCVYVVFSRQAHARSMMDRYIGWKS